MNSDRFLIRPGNASDIEPVSALWVDLVAHHVEKDDGVSSVAKDGQAIWKKRLFKALNNPTCRLYVAETIDSQQLIGFVTGFLQYTPPVFIETKIGWVADIFVKPEFRRRRIALRLVDRLMDWFRSESVDHIEVNIAARNQGAITFWQTVGARDYMRRMWIPVKDTPLSESTGRIKP